MSDELEKSSEALPFPTIGLIPVAPVKECWRHFGPADLTSHHTAGIINVLQGAVFQGFERVHFLFQSRGGDAENAFRLYNFFRNYPADLVIYNNGFVGSSAAIAFLGAHTRYTSNYSAFLFHTPYYVKLETQRAAQLARASGFNQQIADEWLRLLAENVTFTEGQQEELVAGRDVILMAKAALEVGIAEEGEFMPPLTSNEQVKNIIDFVSLDTSKP